MYEPQTQTLGDCVERALLRNVSNLGLRYEPPPPLIYCLYSMSSPAVAKNSMRILEYRAAHGDECQIVTVLTLLVKSNAGVLLSRFIPGGKLSPSLDQPCSSYPTMPPRPLPLQLLDCPAQGADKKKSTWDRHHSLRVRIRCRSPHPRFRFWSRQRPRCCSFFASGDLHFSSTLKKWRFVSSFIQDQRGRRQHAWASVTTKGPCSIL